jgi:hypothetical protein
VACPEGVAQTAIDGACSCADGYYNTSHSARCIAADFAPTKPALLTCLPCDELAECVDICQAETLEILPGWTLLARTDASVSIFQCKHEEACERRSNVSLHDSVPNKPPVCAAGYLGVLCGACTKGYQLTSDGGCTACGTTTWVGSAAVTGVVIIGVFMVTQVYKWFDSVTFIEGLLGLIQELQLKAITKIVVATAQIVSSFTPVLNIQMPPIFQKFLDVLSIFNFDISLMIGVGCFSNGSYATSLATSFVLVVVVGVLVGIEYLYEMRKVRRETEGEVADMSAPIRTLFDRFDVDTSGTIELAEMIELVQAIDESATAAQATGLFRRTDTDGDGALDFDEFLAAATQPAADGGLDLRAMLNRHQKADVRGNAIGRLFLLVFLLYPMLTNKIFEVFLCRDLGPNTSPASVLYADYTVDCDETATLRWLGGGALVLLWPIGLPAGLFYAMHARRAKILAGDEATLRTFAFVLGDYKPTHWYWEVVELSRKLIMSGLLGLVGRGSIGQAVIAVVLAFSFFAIALKHQPFTNGRLNFLKICSEAQLFGILLLCFLIQAVKIGPVGLAAEPITFDGYGVIMVVIAAIVAPIALGSIYLIATDAIESRKADATEVLADAAAVEDARPLGLRPVTFEQEFVAPPAWPTTQPQQVATTSWVEMHSEEHGHAYWHNPDTGQTTWDRPIDLVTTVTEATTGSTTNPVHDSHKDNVTVRNQSGWSEHWSADESRPFWVDDSTGDSTWVRPNEMAT